MGETCGNFRFFLLQNPTNKAGLCRRYPPDNMVAGWMTQKPGMLMATPMAQSPEDCTVSNVQNIAAQFPGMTSDGGGGEWAANATALKEAN